MADGKQPNNASRVASCRDGRAALDVAAPHAPRGSPLLSLNARAICNPNQPDPTLHAIKRCIDSNIAARSTSGCEPCGSLADGESGDLRLHSAGSRSTRSRRKHGILRSVARLSLRPADRRERRRARLSAGDGAARRSRPGHRRRAPRPLLTPEIGKKYRQQAEQRQEGADLIDEVDACCVG